MENKKMDDDIFQAMQLDGNFEIKPVNEKIDFENRERFQKLVLTGEQKSRINAMMQYVPAAMSSASMGQAYIVKFPEGVVGTLTKLKQGGFGSMIKGADGQFVGNASLYQLSEQAAFLGGFTAMSCVTGQYFLSEINNKLRMIKMNLDKILEFLYGDKKAELLSEISFAKYAYRNYNSIMACDQQRIATITSLQEAKKVAIKDVEFYMVDLDTAVNTKENSDVKMWVDRTLQIKDSLDLSMQLFIMSSLLEVYYAENYDSRYLQYLEKEITAYLEKCEKRMISGFSALSMRIGEHKGKLWEKVDTQEYKQRVDILLESLHNNEETPMKEIVHSALEKISQEEEYYVHDGEVYLKIVS